jgi:hypothetical protein
MKPTLTFTHRPLSRPLAPLPAAELPLVLSLSNQSSMAAYGKARELPDEWRTPPANVSLIQE